MRRLPQGLKPVYSGPGCGASEATPLQCIRGLLPPLGLLWVIFLTATILSAQQSPPTAITTIRPAPVQIVPPRPNHTFPDGRSYVYSVEWHLITAGTAVMKMEAAGNERKVAASAESSGAVNVIFPVHDRFESRFDPRTFCSLSIFN